MKKLALGILSVFMILGGVLLSACDKKISLTVSSQQVVIYTNDEQEENYQTKDISVSLENSSAGIGVEILKGNDSVRVSSVKSKSKGSYSFTIYGDKSGDAEIKVSAVEDNKQSKIISVKVNTILEEFKTLQNDSVDARTNLFVVKGVAKNLHVEDYFNFEPVTANVCDVVWSFEDSQESNLQEFIKDDKLCAKIENGKLYVYDDYNLSKISLRASFAYNTSINKSVTFEVLENATIYNLTIEDKYLFQNNILATDEVAFQMTRNNANISSVEGSIVVNSRYNINLDAIVYEKLSNGTKKALSRTEYENYFVLNIESKVVNDAENKITYSFTIDALDTSGVNKFGDFYFCFKVGYAEYNYDITTENLDILLKTFYSATRIELANSENEILNNSVIDVFSSYTTGNGFKIKTSLLPDDVAIDNSLYFITVDLNQAELRNLTLPGTDPVSSLAKFYCRGQELVFTCEAGSSLYKSSYIQNGSDVYVSSAGEIDILEGVVFGFVSASNASAKTSLTMNFYKISTDEVLRISDDVGDDIPKITYISSSMTAARSITFKVKIGGLSTLSGLSLKNSANSKFEFSSLQYISSNVSGVDGAYVIVNFMVTLNSANFDSTTSFYFEHVTGKKSETFSIRAFVPLSSVSITNDDKSSSDVYIDEQENQSFIDSAGVINVDASRQSSSLSKLMLEAGTSIPLNINYQNATLSDVGISYKFLSFSKLIEAIGIVEGITDGTEAEARANQLFDSSSLNTIALSYFRYFENNFGTYFNIKQDKLTLTDNAFKGYVCVMFSGYDENHNEIVLVRFFALESYYSVRYLSSNIKTTLLYTTETLSLADISKSRVDVTVTMRPDAKIPTYSNILSSFVFTSAVQEEWDIATIDGSYLKNRYYEISNISFASGGRYFKFRITANSTNLNTSVNDILTISYLDANGMQRKTEIQIEIKNAKRIEGVQWLNQTQDNEIYLNLTTSVSSERSFTISTSVLPSDADDIGLTYVYFPTAGSANDLKVTTASIGQTFNLNINTMTGGYGSLYLLPNDMVKIVDGVNQVLMYRYTQDQQGKIIETPVYKRLSEIGLYYDEMISGSENISNYFYNNSGEKIYYKDIIVRIAITIADGLSEGTAIRIYNEADLQAIDTAKYYKIMNNITLSNWKSFNQFSGMFFGKDETVTLRFENGSQNFVNELLANGTIKNLIFAGEVTSSGTEAGGFVVNTNRGTIDGVCVDVYYSSGEYKSSKLKAYSSSTGGIAGYNSGTIKNSYNFGMTIDAENAVYVGGIVGQNYKDVLGCGVEFYNFVRLVGGNPVTESNYITTTTGQVGGIVGFGGANSSIGKSYAYAYSLIDAAVPSVSTIIKNGNIAKGAFMAAFSDGAKVSESFAFLGDLRTPVNSNTSAQMTTFTNVYLSYYRQNVSTSQYEIFTRVFRNAIFAYSNQTYSGDLSQMADLNAGDIPSDYSNPTDGSNWKRLVDLLDKSVWETTLIDSDINFGFVYLKNVVQSAAVDVANISIADNTNPLKSLNAGTDTTGIEKGILFATVPKASITNAAEQSALTSLNTISIADLFGVSVGEARSLLLTSDSKNIAISTSSIKILGKNVNKFAITVHSKMNFTSTKTFEFVILNYLPVLKTTVDQMEIKNNMTVLVQTGLDNSRSILFGMNSTIYLNGTGYATEKDNFSIDYVLENNSSGTEDYVSASKNNNSLVLSGLKNHENDAFTTIQASVVIEDIANDEDFAEAIKAQRNRTFNVSVYNGATSLVVSNAANLEVKPSSHAVFDVQLKTDATNDDLVFGIKYGEIEIKNEIASGQSAAKFVVDSRLILNISWTKTEVEGGFSFKIWVKIDDSVKHLIIADYENLTIKINAKSQASNTKYQRLVGLNVRTQEIEDISISTYNIPSENRQIRNSVLYIRPANEITNTLTPSSDAIVAVSVDPAYAMMTHFNLTYSAIGTSGNVGTVSISKLSYNPLYGYYVNMSSTTLITNGIRVNLSDDDRKDTSNRNDGYGVFYFRIYISSAFTTDSSLKLTLTFYNGTTELTSGTHNLNVDYMQDANIKVNGASTYVLAKGNSATVTVTVGLDQELDDLYLQNNSANISLTSPTVTVYASYKVYTATLIAYVDAKLDGGKSSGIFYACASVKRVVNNALEIKVSRATLCLVDFSVEGSGISVAASGGRTNYNGGTYDVFYSYVNATDRLAFNYQISPETYSYDKNNASEVAAVNKMLAARNQFALKNNFKDDEVGYYINYVFNENTGEYEAVALKQQLWYASDESNSTAVYNNNYGTITQHDCFGIDEVDVSGSTNSTYLTITGKRTGRQLMKLRTTIIYQGLEFNYDYYFLVVVDIWSDEDTPTQIFTAEDFVNYATKSEKADDYILMNDIVLSDYTPLNTDLIKSFDGNGYTIHINSFAYSQGNALRLALFDVVAESSTLKNIRVNLYNGGQISVNISQYRKIDIAGFALQNNGVIYNCEVLSYYDLNYQKSTVSGNAGLVVKYTLGTGSDPIQITPAMVSVLGVETKVSGFVSQNNASIISSRVGGESFKHIIDVAGIKYIKSQSLSTFVIEGQGEVSGFAGTNSDSGYISASFADNVQIYNNMASTTSITAGFAAYNFNNIQNSYAEGKGEKGKPYNNLTNISSIGIIAGFVYENSSIIKNSYSNIAIENSKSKGSMVAGFVYINKIDAEISLCYSSCEISKTDINQMQFSGVDDFANSLNFGSITNSYFYDQDRNNDTNQSKITTGALGVSDIDEVDTFYGFSFSSEEDAYNGIWKMMENGISLVSANQIAFSNRYAVTKNNVTSIFYNKSILEADTMKSVNLSYGSQNNPIILRSAYDFAMATGKASTKEISSYKEYYSDTQVFGNYRVVKNIDMSEIDQNSESVNSIKLTTTSKTFTGLLDGNGFTVSNINLGSSVVVENYGLFAKLDGAVVMNLDLIVDSIHNSQANIVGTLAGTAIDSRILAISLSPVEKSQGSVSKTSIQGNNVVGGIVGMLFGESSMSDIHVEDIDIYSSYYLRDKNVNSNDGNVGENLRGNIENRSSIYTYVSKISYAGAIAGYVDIYNSLNSEYVKFSTSLEVSDYNIVTVHVSSSVNIYGEVAGGLFGYVGNSTFIYDATIELDSNMSLSKPSYIISKNLYSGGIIGENYGGLFAVSAAYEKELQSAIEQNENKYYSGNLGAEKGQQSIFSYTPADADYISNRNDPLYIGGLVGYMGGGYIYIGYSKLNIISHSASTLAVGGIIGLAGYRDTMFDLNFANSTPKVNILLYDVYASGDVYADAGNAVSAGIVGALENKGAKTTILGLKNVLAVNYFSYNGSKLVGDKTPTSTGKDKTYASDRHFMIVGKIYNGSTEVKVLNANLFFINTDDDDVNILKSAEGTARVGSLTVGGYSVIKLGSDEIYLNPYGFNVSWDVTKPIYDPQVELYKSILKVEHIGSSSMNTMPVAYAKMYSYFLSNGWSDEFWNHAEDTLFPHIELLPKLNVIFWDAYEESTDRVLRSMRSGSGITVVVRGKTTKDNDTAEYTDIDLSTTVAEGGVLGIGAVWEAISGFRGTLISYFDYMNSTAEGFVTREIYGPSPSGEILKGGHSAGEKPADKVGIILNKPLLKDAGDNLNIEGVNFYFYDKTGTSHFSLIEKSVNFAVFRDVNIVLDNDVVLTTQKENSTSLGDIYTTGLICKAAYSTSFVDVNITFRNDAEVTMQHTEKDATSNPEAFMGLLAGYMEQKSGHTQMSISGIKVVCESEQTAEEDPEININIEAKEGTCSTVYAGLYVGNVFKGKSGKISMGLAVLGNVNINAKMVGEGTPIDLYIGGYAGKISGVDNVSVLGKAPESSTKEDENAKLSIILRSNFREVYAGLGFGYIDNSNLNITNDSGIFGISGGVYQIGNVSCELANLGGIAGYVNFAMEVHSLVVDFNVGKLVLKKDSSGNVVMKDGEAVYQNYDYNFDEETEETVFDQNLYDYSDELSSFVVTGGDGKGNYDNIGGLFGKISGARISFNGEYVLSGIIDIMINQDSIGSSKMVMIGGFIGQTTGAVQANVSVENSINVSVQREASVSIYKTTAYVGGLIGKVTRVEGGGDSQIIIAGMANCASYTGTVLSCVENLVFGGAVGNIERGFTGNSAEYADPLKMVTISRIVYGGAVKIYGKSNGSSYYLPENIVVGGIVGQYNLFSGGAFDSKGSLYEISNCFAYGDVFVNYLPYNNSRYVNAKLATYNFGGIVGSASYIKISNCYSMMTSFNDRLSTDYLSKRFSYTNAIAGANSGVVTYTGNQYSSSVCLAYQQEAGNTDVLYGNNSGYEYSGYSSITKNEEITSTNEISSQTSILNVAEAFVRKTGELVVGHKLRPYEWTQDNQNEQILTTEDDSIENGVLIEGIFHNITWVALVSDLTGEYSISNPIADNLTNVAFVGNGHTITRIDEETKEVTVSSDIKGYGGLVNSLGASFNESSTENTPNFNIFSGVIADLEIVADLNFKIGAGIYAYGGVVGIVWGNSFVYGVGVKGGLSVGGLNNQLRLGGVVGFFGTGIIDECYVDADIAYRADNGGLLSGVANVGNFSSIIRATYSSGLLETYVDINVYTFAYTTKTASIDTTSDIIDCYSISQVKRNNALSSSFTQKIYFINSDESNGFSIYGNVVNGNDVAVVNGGSTKVVGGVAIDDMSLPYYNYSPDKSQSIVLKGSKAKDSWATWYFNPYVNYGYASHGFGYLKNVTTYTREIKAGDDSSASEITEYVYTPVSYRDIVEDDGKYGIGMNSDFSNAEWFLGVPSQGKFDQMYDTIETGSLNYNNDYKFVLRYSFDVTKNSLGKNIGSSSGKNLIIDGNNNTISWPEDAKGTKAPSTGLFGIVYGNIENLRLTGVDVDSSSQYVGALASKVVGNLDSVTVAGNIKASGYSSSTSYIGGAVGCLEGTGKNVNSVAVISNSNNRSIMGGVVGYLKGSLTNSSNSGSLLNEAIGTTTGILKSGSSSDYITITATKFAVNDTKTDTSTHTLALHSISGGVVGYSDGGKIESCYNANSVLDGFTKDKSSNYAAGGVVGYANSTEITNCHNTGLVGAGNYDNTGYAFAGGIFGYGIKASVSDCLNDGAVQAIGKNNISSSERDQKSGAAENAADFSKTYRLDKIIKSGDKFEEYTKDPKILIYEITMTYNPGRFRRVYSYGIGYNWTSSGGKVENCSSSIENIKNDGNVGEIITKAGLIFDRQAMLDNDKGVLEDFEGRFDVGDEKIYTNGYDSYEYPSRIYMNDTMSRRYWNSSKSTNDIATKEKDPIPGGKGDEREINGIFSYDGKWKTDKLEESNLFSGGSNEVQYYMLANTTYYSPAYFEEYINILKDEKNKYIGLVGYSGGIVENAPDVDVCENIEEQISNICEKTENDKTLKNITINGKKTAIVYNSINFRVAYAPYEYIATVQIPKGNIDVKSLTKKSFSISDIIVGGEAVRPQSCKVSYIVNGDTIEITAKIYFSAPVSEQVSFSVVYTAEPTEVVLGKNNVVEQYGRIYIILEDKDGQTQINQEIVNRMNLANGNFKNINIEVNGTFLNNWTIGYNDGSVLPGFDNVAYLEYRGSYSKAWFDEKAITITYDEIMTPEDYTTHSINTSTSSETFTIDGSNSFSSVGTFEGYDFDIFRDIFDINGNTYEYVRTTSEANGLNYVTGAKISLDLFLDAFYRIKGYNVSKMSFGNSNYSITYVSNLFSILQDGVDGFKLSIRNESGVNYIYIEKADIVGGTTENVIIGTSPSIRDYSSEVNAFMGTFYNFGVYFNKNSIRLSYSLNESYPQSSTQGSFEFMKYFTIQNNGRFGKNGVYSGNFAEFEAESGAGIHTENVTLFGLTFYNKTVTYSYRMTGCDLINKGVSVGYDITFYNGSVITNWAQGYLLSQAESSVESVANFSGAFFETSNKFIVKYYTTNKINAGNDEYLTSGEEGSDYFSLSTDLIYGDYEISIEKGKETCPLCGSNENYVRTAGGYSGLATEYQYVYTIYGCGTISVEYRYYDAGGINQSKTETYSRRFVTNSDLIAQNRMYEYRIKGTIETEVDDEGNSETVMRTAWVSPGTSTTLIWDRFSKYDCGGAFYDTIYVNLIASYFDSSQILFARYPSDNPTFDNLNVKRKTEFIQPRDAKKNLTSLAVESVSLDSIAMHEGTFQYKKISESVWTKSEVPFISCGEYGKYIYEYKYRTSTTSAETALVEVVDGNVKEKFEYIIIAGDLNAGDFSLDINDKVVIGNGHNLKFVKSGVENISFFGTNNNRIENLNVIGMTSVLEAEISGQISSIFVQNNKSNLLNVNVYGNIRNIAYTSTTAGAWTSPTVRPAIGVSSVDTLKNINSYVCMTGLDAKKHGDRIFALLEDSLLITKNGTDSYDTTNYKGYSVILSGNGANGINGAAGENAGKSGAGGGSGGAGGSISVRSASFFGFARVGAGGYAGYGGNGAHGKYDKEKVLGGGAGGKAGIKGSAGRLYINDAVDAKKITLNISTENQNITSKAQIGGNGGVGGLGRVSGANYYISAAGGDAGTDSDGATVKDAASGGISWSTPSLVWNNLGSYGFATELDIVKSKSHCFPTGFGTIWGKAGKEWKENVNSALNNDSKIQSVAGQGTESYHGKGIQITKVFVSIQVRAYRHGFAFNLHVADSRKTVWTSGETLNSGGAAGTCGTVYA